MKTHILTGGRDGFIYSWQFNKNMEMDGELPVNNLYYWYHNKITGYFYPVYLNGFFFLVNRKIYMYAIYVVRNVTEGTNVIFG